jgi:hypothetical protein
VVRARQRLTEVPAAARDSLAYIDKEGCTLAVDIARVALSDARGGGPRRADLAAMATSAPEGGGDAAAAFIAGEPDDLVPGASEPGR